MPESKSGYDTVQFSLLGIYHAYLKRLQLSMDEKITSADIEDALLCLSGIGAMSLEGGFLVLYNALKTESFVIDNRWQYKVDDYRCKRQVFSRKNGGAD